MENKDKNDLLVVLRTLLLMMAFGVPLNAQNLPKLLVNITIDELREDYLEELKPILSKDGINKFLEEGRVFKGIEASHSNLNRASALSTIFTGSTPAQNSISFPRLYNFETSKTESVFFDRGVNAIYSRESLSPKALSRYGIADYLKASDRAYTLIYSVAANADAAIITGGHSANGAYWLDDSMLSWASSSYYGDMPWYISQYNRSKDGLNQRIIHKGEEWTISDKKILDHLRSRGFKSENFEYTYRTNKIHGYKTSRLANDEVAILAEKLIENAGFENKSTLSMLSIVFDASMVANKAIDLNAETADKYIGIDKNISSILRALDKKIGLKNCAISLITTPYFENNLVALKPKDNELIFDTDRAGTIINMYLTALYGQGNWVSVLEDGILSLNNKLINSKKISISEVEYKVVSILKDMSGIDIAISGTDLRSAHKLADREDFYAKGLARQKNVNIYWTLKQGYSTKTKNNNQNVNRDYIAIPSTLAILSDQKLLSSIPFEVKKDTDIAKVISWVMRIRPPTSKP